jgi:hypothetical protein
MSDLHFTWYGGLADENGLHSESRRAREGLEFQEKHDIDRATAKNVAQGKESQQRASSRARSAEDSTAPKAERGTLRAEVQRRTAEEIAESVHARLARHVRHNRLEASDAHDPRSTRGESELQHGMKKPGLAQQRGGERRMSAAEFALAAEQLRAVFKRARRDAAEKRRVGAQPRRVEQVAETPRPRRTK